MRLKNTNLKVKNNEIWASPIMPNTVYIPFFPIVSKYSTMLRIRKAMEFIIP